MRSTKTRTFIVLAGCAIWLAVLGWVDRATGFELGLFAFYTAPVGVVAWNLGQRPGIIAAFIASVVWYLADRYAGDRYSNPFYVYWNTGMHFTTFIINAVTFAKIKSSLDQRHELERALVDAREKLKQLSGLLSICSQCRKPYTPVFLRPKTEEFPAGSTPSAAQSAALCDECRERPAPAWPRFPSVHTHPCRRRNPKITRTLSA